MIKLVPLIIALSTLQIAAYGEEKKQEEGLRSNTLEEAAKVLKVNPHYHSVLSSDQSYRVHPEGYIIGFEKISRERLFPQARKSREVTSDQKHLSGEALSHYTFLKRRLSDAKCLVPTHAVRFGASNDKPRVVFSVYDGVAKNHAAAGVYEQTWDEITALRKTLAADLRSGRYTHILLQSQGWHTDQHEAVENYGDMVREMTAAAKARGEKFRPLFIGLSWNSYWWNVGPSVPGRISLGNKANDADEIAMIWANHLLRDVLIPLKHEFRTPLVLIGHSLGARLLSSAAVSGWALKDSPQSHSNDIDLMIGLEGALDFKRFTKANLEPSAPVKRTGDIIYHHYNTYARQFVFTGSEEDFGMNGIGIVSNIVNLSPYIGSKAARKQAEKAPDRFATPRVEKGDFASIRQATKSLPKDGRVILVDATSFIDGKERKSGNKNAPDAHSDIYDRQAGEFLYGTIARFTRTK